MLKFDITDCFNKKNNKIQTAVTNMMKQSMLQKIKISPERLDVSYVTTDIFRSDSKNVTVKL